LRFLLDGMLGKLSRWLRMLGYETIYQNDLSDNDLLAAAKRDSLILLTSDEELYRNASIRGLESFLIQGRTESERLASLAKRYNLTLKINPKDSRCPTCGAPIKETPKDELEGAVPPATFKVYSTFWVCTNPKCAKLYWQGSHWKKIEQTLKAAKIIHDSNSKTSTDAKHAEP